MTLPELRKLLRRWQKQLRLQSWDIKLRLMPQAEAAENPGTLAYVSWSNQYQAATITISQYPPDGYDLEETLIHELLHLRIEGHLEQEETVTRDLGAREMAINVLSGLLVKNK